MSRDENHIERTWALRLLRIFCPAHLYEEIEGDLIQRFNRDLRMEMSTLLKCRKSIENEEQNED